MDPSTSVYVTKVWMPVRVAWLEATGETVMTYDLSRRILGQLIEVPEPVDLDSDTTVVASWWGELNPMDPPPYAVLEDEPVFHPKLS